MTAGLNFTRSISLRRFLACWIAVAAIAAVWVVAGKSQMVAVREIVASGGACYYSTDCGAFIDGENDALAGAEDFRHFLLPVTYVHWRSDKSLPCGAFERLASLPHLDTLDFYADVDDCQRFPELPALSCLTLGTLNIPDAVLEGFARSPRLTSLSCEGPFTSWSSVEPFADGGIETLRIAGLRDAESAAHVLGKFRTLKRATVFERRLSIDSLRELCNKNPELRYLEFDRSEHEDGALIELRNAFPHVQFVPVFVPLN